MAIIHVDESYPGLPNSGRLSGTNGDLVGIMDIALVANGWAIEYTSGNARVYRPATGNRFRLHMNDDSAVSGSAGHCTVRGCENASDATTLFDPFPTVANKADNLSVWPKSNVASTAARVFDIWVGETWVFYSANIPGTTNTWDCAFFGDIAPALPGDSYNTVCYIKNTTSLGSYTFWAAGSNTFTAGGKWWFARTYSGAVKSTTGTLTFPFTTIFSDLANSATAQGGPSGGVDTQKVAISDAGVATGAPSAAEGLPIRGWVPNIRFPLHSGRGALNSRDTYTNTAYNPSFIGNVITGGTTAASDFLTFESSDTWNPPSG